MFYSRLGKSEESESEGVKNNGPWTKISRTARFMSKVKINLINFNLSPSQLAVVSLAECAPKLFLLCLTLLVNESIVSLRQM